MKTINVQSRFAISNPDMTQTIFEPGIQEVSDELAEHWFVKAHSTEVVPEKQSKKPVPAPTDALTSDPA